MRELDAGGNSVLQIGADLLANPQAIGAAIAGPTALLVSGAGVPEPLRQQVLTSLAQLPIQHDSLQIRDDEESKTLDSVMGIFDHLLAKGHGRDTTLLALGGGITGDMTGFAAACYQRGVPWINLPTTLLAQVDASIGGKTGVNHRLGKNMIGAFHPPARVLADIGALQSLPPRHIGAGLAEIIKHAFIVPGTFADWLEQQLPALLAGDPDRLQEAVFLSSSIKAEIVKRDLRESGERALLNFGHTFAHAIETHLNYKQLLHGEAVAIGMALASDFSVAQGYLSPAIDERLKALLALAELPLSPPQGMSAEDFLRLMQHDKKVLSQELRLVLLRTEGEASNAFVTPVKDRKPLLRLLRERCRP